MTVLSPMTQLKFGKSPKISASYFATRGMLLGGSSIDNSGMVFFVALVVNPRNLLCEIEKFLCARYSRNCL